MNTINPIFEIGSPIIREKCKLVDDPQSEETNSLIDKLIHTVHTVRGVGLAAPQIGIPLRVCIIASHPNPRYPNAPFMKPLAMINPEITDCSTRKTSDWEGCLSIPFIRGKISRHSRVTVLFLDRKGRNREKIFKDFVARIVQHELDHLQGKVFLDRLKSTLDIISEKEYQQIVSSS